VGTPVTVGRPVRADGGSEKTPPAKSRLRRIAGTAGGFAVVAVVFAVILPRIADYSEVWDVMTRLTTAELLALAVATLINVATYGPPWMAALPGLGYRQSMVLTQTSTALSVAVPGGDAVGIAASYAMLRGWGFNRSAVAVAVVVTGVWNQIVNIVLPLLALSLLLLSGGSSPLLLTAGLIGMAAVAAVAVALALVLRGEPQARATGERAERLANRALRLARRHPRAGWGEAVVQFRRETIDLLARRWAAITVAAFAGHLAVFGVLIVSLRATGVDAGQVSWVEALAAWGLVRLLTAVPVTPGGVGIVELGLSSALVGFGADNAEAVAAVLLYRVLTVIPTLVLGGILGLTWRRHRVVPSAE
jgi:putative heme transporter